MENLKTCGECKGPIEKRGRKFCSLACLGRWRSRHARRLPHGRVTELRKCENCSKEFPAVLAEVRRGYGRFCSRSCAATSNLRSRLSTRLLQPNTECNVCGQPFYRKPSILKKKTTNYCSMNCYYAVKRKIDKDPRNGTPWRRLKELVREKRGRCCEICKWGAAQCDIHHKIPVKDGGGNEEDNLMLLCPNHHRMADLGIPLFS